MPIILIAFIVLYLLGGWDPVIGGLCGLSIAGLIMCIINQ